MKLLNFTKSIIWNKCRNALNRKNVKRLSNVSPTIISSNCNGSIILHDLHLKFLSPTINLFIYPKDFLKFVSNLDKYLNTKAQLVQVDSQLNYPVGKLIDIEIHFMHYSTFEEAKTKWLKRCKRVKWDNIFLMMTDRDGCTYNDIAYFDKLPYKKVIFTNKEYPEFDSAYYFKGFENKGCVGVLSNKKSLWGKRYLDDFDYVSFLNSNSNSAKN
jgi:uncharacterized protein (DUF1919 family)